MWVHTCVSEKEGTNSLCPFDFRRSLGGCWHLHSAGTSAGKGRACDLLQHHCVQGVCKCILLAPLSKPIALHSVSLAQGNTVEVMELSYKCKKMPWGIWRWWWNRDSQIWLIAMIKECQHTAVSMIKKEGSWKLAIVTGSLRILLFFSPFETSLWAYIC